MTNVPRKRTDENPYPDSNEQAAERLRLTLAFLTERRLPPTPVNYQIGYDYVAGKDTRLVQAVDAMPVANGRASNQSVWGLYQRFFMESEDALESMRQTINRIIDDTKNEFHDGTKNLVTYRDTLERFSRLLANDSAPVSQSDVNNVLDKTRKTEAQQQGLVTLLSAVTAEISDLRNELAQVREESLLDALTKISNRRAFDTFLANTVQQAQEAQETFSLLVIDIDHFKKFNDSYGHLVGDKVLRFVASTLKRSVKGKDFVARFGGEEFVVLLPMTRLPGATSVAEEIRTAISLGELTDKSSGKNYGKITASIGVAEFRIDDSPTELVQRADQALYLAKDQGRNRVGKIA